MSYNLALIKLDPGFELKSNISLPEMGQKFTDYVTFIGYDTHTLIIADECQTTKRKSLTHTQFDFRLSPNNCHNILI